MIFEDAIALTRKLVSFDTITPPGNEGTVALFLGELLFQNGFTVRYDRLSANSLTLVAEKGLIGHVPPIVLTGHLDTIPLGATPWDEDPFSGTIKDGKIYGRGTSDMKSGVASMVCAAVQAFRGSTPEGGVRLIFTAGEEPGCLGAQHLADTRFPLGCARAILVGEPTANIPAIGHKGALYLYVSASGKTAHSSMPHLGENAVYKVARAIARIEEFCFHAEPDGLHGLPTINVGMVGGGKNLNSVPDSAWFTIDIRSTPNVDHTKLLERLSVELGPDVSVEKRVDLRPVTTEESSSFVQMVYDVCGIVAGGNRHQKSLPYVTDGSVLQRLYCGVPTVILGPGQPQMAHQTNEFCQTSKIKEAVNLYKEIILRIGEVR
ncbi:MAG: M20 family metallopeptidase [Lentimicrobium sp.]|nr:M20 family metallopeptidase [Lentimicrobium sp.]